MDIFCWTRRLAGKALNPSNVFIAGAELELNGDATCQREPLVGNPITSNPIGPVVRTQQLVSTLSLRLPVRTSWLRQQSCYHISRLCDRSVSARVRRGHDPWQTSFEVDREARSGY